MTFLQRYPLSNLFAGFFTFLQFVESHPTLQFIFLQIALFLFDLLRQKILHSKTKRKIKQSENGKIEIDENQNV